MKKSELRTGILVETASGELGLVMLNTPKGDIIASENVNKVRTWGPLGNYDENLIFAGDRSKTIRIDKVYDFHYYYNAASLITEDRSLLWERRKVELQLTDKYKAVLDMDSEDALVGCQRVPFEKVLELAEMIADGK